MRSGLNSPSGLSNTGLSSIAGLQHIDGMQFHQRLQPFGQRRLAAADRAEQVHDLLALFEALRGMAQEADDSFDRLFHAVEFGERRIDPDRPVHEDAAESRILRGVDHLRLADRGEQTLGRGRVHHRIVATCFQILGKRHLGFAVCLEASGVGCEQVIDRIHRPLRQLGGHHLALMQDGCERSVSRRRRVNVFSLGHAVCMRGVTGTVSAMLASCPAWLAATLTR